MLLIRRGGNKKPPDNRKPIKYDGVEYESYTAAAVHFGLAPSTVKDRLLKGHPLEIRNAQRLVNRKKVT